MTRSYHSLHNNYKAIGQRLPLAFGSQLSITSYLADVVAAHKIVQNKHTRLPRGSL